MSVIYTEITLVNTWDETNVRRGLIKEADVRQTTVKALAGTGAWSLVINEALRAQLGLEITEQSEAEVAGGITEKCGVTELVTIHWKDRRTVCEAVVLPQEEDVLLGTFPLNGMDLMIDPKREEVVGAHGDKIAYMVK
jgi:clan AA aspartic protease